MLRADSRFVVSHVGSMVRPAAMIPYLQKAQAGEAYDKAEFEACLTESVIDAVQLQAEAGIDVVSDGEYGKSGTWAFYVHRRLKGIEWRSFTEAELKDPMITVISGRDREAFPEFYAEYDARVLAVARSAGRPIVTAPLVYTGQAELQRDIANLKAGLARAKDVTGFLPVVAPASALPNARNEYYRDEESFLFALADALRTEYRAIIDAGLDLQVDDAFIPFMYEKMVPPMTLAQYRQWAALRIAALNHALEGLPPERTRYHICWGSWNGPHMFDVPLKDIVDLVLEVKTGALSFEAANPRHEHEWRIWKEVRLPPGKVLMPGLIAHSTNIVEHPELVAERLMRFAECVGRDNLMAGTDCGFSQSPLAGRVHRSIMWAKLRTLAEGAAIASKMAWG
jgi:5-methyltetrahydropteroyltriglutamate--homocysteine methyltransferase